MTSPWFAPSFCCTPGSCASTACPTAPSTSSPCRHDRSPRDRRGDRVSDDARTVPHRVRAQGDRAARRLSGRNHQEGSFSRAASSCRPPRTWRPTGSATSSWPGGTSPATSSTNPRARFSPRAASRGRSWCSIGALTPKDLFRGLIAQVRGIVVSLCGWDRGGWRFIEGLPPQEEIVSLRLHPAGLIFEGLALIAADAALERRVGPAAARTASRRRLPLRPRADRCPRNRPATVLPGRTGAFARGDGAADRPR